MILGEQGVGYLYLTWKNQWIMKDHANPWDMRKKTCLAAK